MLDDTASARRRRLEKILGAALDKARKKAGSNSPGKVVAATAQPSAPKFSARLPSVTYEQKPNRKIREKRAALKVSQKELSLLSGVPTGVISKFERGVVPDGDLRLTRARMNQLAIYFETSVEDLFPADYRDAILEKASQRSRSTQILIEQHGWHWELETALEECGDIEYWQEFPDLLRNVLEQALAELAPKEEAALRLYYGFDTDGARVPRQKIAQMFGVSDSAVSCRVLKALKKLRRPMHRGLRDYLS